MPLLFHFLKPPAPPLPPTTRHQPPLHQECASPRDPERKGKKGGRALLFSDCDLNRDLGVVNCVGLNSCSCFLLSGQMLRGFARVCVCVCVCFGFPLISLSANLHYCRLTLLFHLAPLLTCPPHTHLHKQELIETCTCASACGCLRASATKVEQMY